MLGKHAVAELQPLPCWPALEHTCTHTHTHTRAHTHGHTHGHARPGASCMLGKHAELSSELGPELIFLTAEDKR
jgi:hypothetical protein